MKNLETETGRNSVDCLVGQVYLDQKAGHPWSQEDGWDLLYIFAQTEEHLDRMIECYEQKFWRVWVRDNTGRVLAVMYQPREATGPWTDSYGEMLKRCRGMLPNAQSEPHGPTTNL